MAEEKTEQFDLQKLTAEDKKSLITGAENSIMKMVRDKQLELPPNYSVGNAMNAAWLVLSDTKDRNSQPALTVCSKASIGKALLKTAVLGLTPAKNQIYYIVYGKTLNAQPSYLGISAIAKRMNGVEGEPKAQAIFEGDVITYDIQDGYKVNLKHTQKFGSIDTSKVIGAYATITYNGKEISEVMTIEQCRVAWNMGAAKGASPAHKGFPDEMAKKTVISRLCKMIINTSDDSDLIAQELNESIEDTADVVENVSLEAENALEADDDEMDIE